LLTTSVDGNTADIVVNGDEIDLRVKSLDPVTGLPASTSGIKVNASGVLIGNTLQSDTFAAGISGWQIKEGGDAEFQSVRIRGFTMPTSGTEYDVYVKTTPGVGEYATISEALSDLSQSYMTFVDGGVQATIHVEDGFEVTSTIAISNINLGWIKITGGSAVAPIVVSSSIFMSLNSSSIGPILDLYLQNTSSYGICLALFSGSSIKLDSLYLYGYHRGIQAEDGSLVNASVLNFSGITKAFGFDGIGLTFKQGSILVCEILTISGLGDTDLGSSAFEFLYGSSASIDSLTIEDIRTGGYIGSSASVVVKALYATNIGNGSATYTFASEAGGRFTVINIITFTNVLASSYNFYIEGGGCVTLTYTYGLSITCNIGANSYTASGMYFKYS